MSAEDKPPLKKIKFTERMKELLGQLMDLTQEIFLLANEKAKFEKWPEKNILPFNKALYSDVGFCSLIGSERLVD